MMKKLLLVFLLLFPVSVLCSWGAVEEFDSIPLGNTGRFVFLEAADTSEFPPLKLLHTALAGYEMLVEEQSVSRPEVITVIDQQQGTGTCHCHSWC